MRAPSDFMDLVGHYKSLWSAIPPRQQERMRVLLDSIEMVTEPEVGHELIRLFHRLLWSHESTLNRIPSPHLTYSRNLAFDRLGDAALAVLEVQAVEHSAWVPILWGNHIWLSVAKLWELVYFLQVHQSGVIINPANDSDTLTLSPPESLRATIYGVCKLLADGAPLDTGWATHPGRICAMPMLGIPRKSPRVAPLLAILRNLPPSASSGWAVDPYPRWRPATPMIYTGSGSHPGGFGRYSTIDPLSMRQAHFLAAVFPNPDWRWPVMVSVVESFLLRSYRNQGAVNHYAQRYGTIFGVRMVDHWYLPVEACIALWTSCNLLPNLAFTTHGTNCWTFNDFWLAGGNKILADVPLYDVTIFNEGRFTCLRFTLVEPPTAGTDVSVPQASRESVVHGVVTYEPNRPTMSFALD